MNTTRDSFHIHVIGISANQIDRSTVDLLKSSILVVAGNTILPAVRNLLPIADQSRFLSITPLATAIEVIEEKICHGNIVVIASGDPLFFGIGEILTQTFDRGRLCFYPAVSSMQLLFARLGLSWHDTEFVSLHGRKSRIPFSEILSAAKVCVLTDRERNPSWLASELLRVVPPDKHHHLTMSVGVALGSPAEEIISGNLKEIASRGYDDPNILLLHNDLPSECCFPVFGLREQEIEHSRGLITKSEVRAAILHNLKLPERGVFWDVGAGSGSISIEASKINKKMEIFAIEKVGAQIANILVNKGKFCAWNIEIVEGEAPAVLRYLPDPDRVFIGGSGGKLAETITMVVDRLRQGGRVIVAAVLDATREQAPLLLHAHGCSVETITISVERMSYPDRQCTRLNPITLIIGQKNA